MYIDSTWGTPPNENIRAATEEAINGATGWNNAGDSTCSPQPAKTGYFLKLVDQSVGQNLRDIIIKKGNTPGACAGNLLHESGTKPDIITIRATAANVDRWRLVILIKHEIGHSLGLDNTPTATSCGFGDIMSIATDAASCVTPNDYAGYDIKSGDVGHEFGQS